MPADEYVDPFDNDVSDAAVGQPSEYVDPFDQPTTFEAQALPGATRETPTGRPPGDPGKETMRQQGAGFATNVEAGIVSDPNVRARLVADRMFPNDPDRYERVGYRGGELVYRDERGGFQAVDAGFTGGAGRFTADLPEMVGAGVGAVAGTFTPVGPLGGAAIGAGIMDAAKRGFSELVYGDEQTIGDYVMGAGSEAALAAGGEGVGRALLSTATRRSVRGADKFDPDSLDALRTRIKEATGINLDYAQASSVRQLSDLKKWAAKYPSEAAEIIEAQGKLQQGQISEAVDQMLQAISPGDDAARLAGESVNAAKGIIEAAEKSALAASRPFYQEAEKKFLADSTVEGLFGDPVIRQAANRVRSNAAYQREIGEIAPYKVGSDIPAGMTQVKFLDLVKRNIDDQIESAKRQGANNRVRLLTGAREMLTDELGKVPAYAKALETYGEIAGKTVTPLKEGIIGQIAKIDSPRLASTVAKMANDILADPQLTASTKKIFQSQGRMGEWRNLVRLSLAKKFDDAARELASASPGNVAGKFRSSVIGRPSQKAAMAGALDGKALKAFEDVMEALEYIGRDVANLGGSDTAFNQAITQQQTEAARGAVSRVGGAVATAVNPFEWRQAIANRSQQKFLEENSVALAEALTDPRKVRKLAELRTVPPSLEKSVMVLAAALGAKGAEWVQDASEPAGEPIAEGLDQVNNQPGQNAEGQ